MNKFKTYRLYRRKPTGVTLAGNLTSGQNSDLVLSKNFSPTTITFRARSDEEAMKKADRFWQDGEFGVGSIIVKEEGGKG